MPRINEVLGNVVTVINRIGDSRADKRKDEKTMRREIATSFDFVLSRDG